jgi:hypothetical protein
MDMAYSSGALNRLARGAECPIKVSIDKASNSGVMRRFTICRSYRRASGGFWVRDQKNRGDD